MTMLDQILERLPVDRREDFLRAVHSLNIRPDSPDLVQAYLATEALEPMMASMRAERAALEDSASRLPDALRALSGEIALVIGDAVRDGVVDAVRSHATDAIEGAAATTMAPVIDQLLEATQTWEQSVESLSQLAQHAIAASDEHHGLLAATRRAMIWALGLAFAAGALVGGAGAHILGVH